MSRVAASPTIALLVAYEGVVALWIYFAFRQSDGGALGVVVTVAAGLAGVVLGGYRGEWRLLLAPLPALLFAIPAGDYHHGELPVWLVVLPALPALAFWIAVGVVVRKLLRRRAERQSSA